MAKLHLKGDSVVADLGAGTGFYTYATAHHLNSLGKGGKVYAVDVQKSLLDRIKQEAERRGLANVQTIWADIDRSGGIKITDRVCDAVIISNVLFQAENKEQFMAEAGRILKPGGEMLLIDWSESAGGLGPTREMLITQVQVEQLLVKLKPNLNLDIETRFDAGGHHWGIILKKN